MTRRRFLFSHDIADDKRRTAVFKGLLDEGGHVQYSVFLCELTHAERITIEARRVPELAPLDDQLLILDVGPVHRLPDTFLRTLSKPYNPPTRSTIV